MMKRTMFGGLALSAVAMTLCLAGAAHAADKYTIDFETKFGVAANSQGAYSSKPEMSIKGKSYLCDSTRSAQEWNERFYSDPKTIKLDPLGHYTVDFDYKILTPESDGGYFYFLARIKGDDWSGHDKGWTQWTSADGDEGHMTINLDLDDNDSYFLIFGNNKQGKVAIDNLVISE